MDWASQRDSLAARREVRDCEQSPAAHARVRVQTLLPSSALLRFLWRIEILCRYNQQGKHEVAWATLNYRIHPSPSAPWTTGRLCCYPQGPQDAATAVNAAAGLHDMPRSTLSCCQELPPGVARRNRPPDAVVLHAEVRRAVHKVLGMPTKRRWQAGITMARLRFVLHQVVAKPLSTCCTSDSMLRAPHVQACLPSL